MVVKLIMVDNYNYINHNYCPFDITRKDVFCLVFNLNENILSWLIISYQKPFVFSVSVFCSQIRTQFKFTAKHWSDLYNFYSKVIFFFFFFFFFCLRKHFLLFFFFLLNLNYWCFTTAMWKFQKNWKRGTCVMPGLKICLQVTNPTDFCIICIHFYYRKKWKYWIFYKHMTRMILFMHR